MSSIRINNNWNYRKTLILAIRSPYKPSWSFVSLRPVGQFPWLLYTVQVHIYYCVSFTWLLSLLVVNQWSIQHWFLYSLLLLLRLCLCGRAGPSRLRQQLLCSLGYRSNPQGALFAAEWLLSRRRGGGDLTRLSLVSGYIHRGEASL